MLEGRFPHIAKSRNTHDLFFNFYAPLIDGGQGGFHIGDTEDEVLEAVGQRVSGVGHLLVCGGVAPCPLNYGVYPYDLATTQVDSLQIVNTA